MGHLDDIDRARGELRRAAALLHEVSLRAPVVCAQIPGATSAAAPLRERLADWMRLLEVAAGELEDWEWSLNRARAQTLATGTG